MICNRGKAKLMLLFSVRNMLWLQRSWEALCCLIWFLVLHLECLIIDDYFNSISFYLLVLIAISCSRLLSVILSIKALSVHHIYINSLNNMHSQFSAKWGMLVIVPAQSTWIIRTSPFLILTSGRATCFTSNPFQICSGACSKHQSYLQKQLWDIFDIPLGFF